MRCCVSPFDSPKYSSSISFIAIAVKNCKPSEESPRSLFLLYSRITRTRVLDKWASTAVSSWMSRPSLRTKNCSARPFQRILRYPHADSLLLSSRLAFRSSLIFGYASHAERTKTPTPRGRTLDVATSLRALRVLDSSPQTSCGPLPKNSPRRLGSRFAFGTLRASVNRIRGKSHRRSWTSHVSQRNQANRIRRSGRGTQELTKQQRTRSLRCRN